MTFNSIKVQLSHPVKIIRRHRSNFQFHKGTIKPINFCWREINIIIFQFHKGTIKPINFLRCRRRCSYFQFHKGTIKPLGFFRVW